MSRLKQSAKVAALAVALVGSYEGLRLATYRDPIGIPTVCFGETKNIKMGMKFTRPECEAMLKRSLIEHEAGMDKCIRVMPTDNQHVAFLSFTYNVGVGAFCKSTLLKKQNAGDRKGACNELLKWTKAGGRELPGLVRRRQEERALCLKGL